MKRGMRVIARGVLCLGLTGCWDAANRQQLQAQEDLARPASCEQLDIDGKASKPIGAVILPPARRCTTIMRNGFPLPDPNCTPGVINPTLTIEILIDRRFTTSCVRDAATKEREKQMTYDWYHIEHPPNNTGDSQICELDHLVSLELGGADTLNNIWPQCGPPGVALTRRYFREKDTVENYLAKQVREGRMDLSAAQKGIATDWTQYLDGARIACPDVGCV
jgi:hypothetical protein